MDTLPRKALLTITALIFTSPAIASSAFVAQTDAFYRMKVTSCATCHENPPALNTYGSALKLPDSLNTKTAKSLTKRLADLDYRDSDADGFLNRFEILQGTNPGNIKSPKTPETAAFAAPNIFAGDPANVSWPAITNSNGTIPKTENLRFTFHYYRGNQTSILTGKQAAKARLYGVIKGKNLLFLNTTNISPRFSGAHGGRWAIGLDSFRLHIENIENGEEATLFTSISESGHINFTPTGKSILLN
ncbi:MAG: hypothetical protein R8M38_05615 [Mariprofundaceae bacterium]